jgi:hypothetical protein
MAYLSRSTVTMENIGFVDLGRGPDTIQLGQVCN